MKFTLAWLKEHLETDATLDAITFALTDLGLEVEGVTDPAARLGAFTVGEVLEAWPHPDADKLRVCRVATAAGEKQIVCGAPNARAGIKVVVAAPGDYVPGIDLTLKVGKIRGVESHGMMLSEREMELSDAHDGIVELDPAAPVGARYVDVVAFDPVIEIAVTPNRPDALGVAGIARDLAARGLGRLIERAPEPVPGAFPNPVAIYLAPDVASEACPLFVGRLIRGVTNGPSPQWLQDRLRAIGLRPISALVDVTNFLTVDRARPLHVFDADKMVAPVTVRLARPGERLTALDGKDYVFDGSETLVCDAHGPEAIGGVMGGLRTGVTEATRNVFVEAAWFDPVRTARTGRRLPHPVRRPLPLRARRRSGRRRARDRVRHPDDPRPLRRRGVGDRGRRARSRSPRAAIALDPGRLAGLVGMDLPRDEQVRILTALGFSATGAGATIEVWVPSWRPDVQGEADLVEEIARVASLSRLRGPAADPRPRRRPSGADPDAAPRGRGPAADCGRRLRRMRDLQLHRRGGGGAVRRRLGRGAAGEPDQLRDEPPAARPAAGPAARGRAQPGARLSRPRPVRGRRDLRRRRARRTAAAGRGPARRPHRAAQRAGRAPPGRPVGRPRRRRGGAGGDRGPGATDGAARGARLVPSRAGRRC